MRPGSVAAFCALLLAGCGTLRNLDFGSCCSGERPGSHRVFGGVRGDLESAGATVGNAAGGPGSFAERAGLVALAVAVTVPVTAIDLPLSAVGDTLTLPLTIPTASHEERQPADAEKTPPQ